MPGFIDYLTALFLLSGGWGKYVLVGVLVVGLAALFISLWGRSTVKDKCSEDYLHGRLRDGYINYWHQWGTEGLSEQEILFQKRLRDAGVDWILEYCLIHSTDSFLLNRKPEFSHINRVTAAWAGYVKDLRGPEGYRWIVELTNGRFLYLRGSFDPSGFEARTALWIRAADSAEKAAEYEMRMKTLERMEKDQEVYSALLGQIKSGERDWAGFRWDTDYAP